jgi:hypothetical protein|tara:strand:- start:825 stop:989 length:165 start_codon:yes stop_codon:yes gene_type:complete
MYTRTKFGVLPEMMTAERAGKKKINALSERMKGLSMGDEIFIVVAWSFAGILAD